jgi:hypothetical protein
MQRALENYVSPRKAMYYAINTILEVPKNQISSYPISGIISDIDCFRHGMKDAKRDLRNLAEHLTDKNNSTEL